MKLGLVSDIHGNLPALQKVLEHLKDCNAILCAGDITGIGPYPNQVIELLVDLQNFKAVIGNHDWFLLNDTMDFPNAIVKKSAHLTRNTIHSGSFHYIKSLPEVQYLSLAGKNIMVVHASPWNHLHEYIYPDYPNFERFQEIEADIIILGHSHVAFSRAVADKMIINPGSVGLARDIRGKASCAVLETSSMKVEFLHLDYPYHETLEYINKKNWPDEFAQFIQPRNHHYEEKKAFS